MRCALLGVGCLVAAVGLVTGCSRSELPQSTALVSPALFILPAARSVQHKIGAEENLSYDLEEERCPAENAIAAITRHVDQIGWRPRTEDILNPGIPTSQVRGWTQFQDGIRHRYVWQWYGQWESNAGEVVSYILRYWNDREEDTACKGPLHVVAVVLSSDEVRQLRERGR